jgi:hypothetical protein
MGKKSFVGAVKGKNADIIELVEREVPDVSKEVKDDLVKKLVEEKKCGDAGDGNGKGGTNPAQTIHNRYPNEPQAGKSYNYAIKDGKLKVENGIKEVDFVVDMDGNLHVGKGHSYLANGRDVQAAGSMKVNNQGYVRRIDNASGHYAPTVEQGKMFPEILNNIGLRTKNAWLELGDYSFTSSGYVDLSKTNTIVEQIK